ncbi:MAG: hypothetical protein U0232_14745 [Thermomicrobiales bacterium]
MDAVLARFREMAIAAARNPAFIHHRWYVDHHLLIVERIAGELCERHPEADATLVNVLVWLHDYGKAIDRVNERVATITRGRAALLAAGFTAEFAHRALWCYERHETYDTLADAPIEVQIASSADGAAHLVGPFYALWWYENPQRPIATLLADNRRKALFDWERKIVLPEVRAAFAARHRLLLEQCGDLPERFIS